MSRKQEIYCELLKSSIVFVRNTSSVIAYENRVSKSDKKQIGAIGDVAHFVHNLTGSLLYPDFGDHDIWFLNFQAKTFFKQDDRETAYMRTITLPLVRELFQLVPDNLRDKLTWEGP